MAEGAVLKTVGPKGLRGSSPRLTASGELAQLGERGLCKPEVRGSNPLFSTKLVDSSQS